MITDKLLELSEAQTLTSTGDAVSTNTLDFGHEGDEAAKTLNLVVQTVEGFESSGAATLAVAVETKNAADSAWTTLLTLPAIAKDKLGKGERPWGFVKVPYGVKELLRLKYTVGTAAFTKGKVYATLTPSLEVK